MVAKMTEDFIKDMKEAKKELIKVMVEQGDFDNADAKTITVLMRLNKLCDMSMDIALEQAHMLDAQNAKLDKLLALAEKRS